MTVHWLQVAAAPAAPVSPVPLAAPGHADVHLFDSGWGAHLLVVDGSRVYDLDDELHQALAHALDGDPAEARELLAAHGFLPRGFIDDAPVVDPPLRALSLAVAQKCNLACTYCYAEGGDFGEQPRNMPWETAEAAVRKLLEGAVPGARFNLAFMGGEPLVNRAVIQRATRFAAELADRARARIGFSITTNGTLVTPADAAFFEEYGFAVTVSLDGVGDTHDRLRPFKGGRGSYARVLANLRPPLAGTRRMQVTARATVTPRNLGLAATLDELIGLGFQSVGFAPMLASPTGRDQLDAGDLSVLLEEMTACGRAFEAHALAGKPYPFSNIMSALDEIHRGTHRPYPCGAGAGYMGVSADGKLAACHRFVGDVAGAMGSLDGGVDLSLQRRWLAGRHVHRQEPCRSCWARYLCGGGCHHEVLRRGRPACDFIRGWLEYCLGAYVRLADARPGHFPGPEPA
jgi:uncharacterized protein